MHWSRLVAVTCLTSAAPADSVAGRAKARARDFGIPLDAGGARRPRPGARM
jgi:hypothetical protein